MAHSARDLSATSDRVSDVSEQIAVRVEDSSTQATVVATAAEEISSNVQTVATGGEQMATSIRVIGHNATEAAHVAARAEDAAEAINVTVCRLGASSRQIGDVVKAITSIAE